MLWHTRAVRSAAVIGLGGLLGMACFDASFLAGAPCTADADCGPRLTCSDGVCGGLIEICRPTGGVVGTLDSEVPARTDQIPAGFTAQGLEGSCAGAFEGQEAAYHWVAPEDGDYLAFATASTEGYRARIPAPSVRVHADTCEGEELGCGVQETAGQPGAARFTAEAGQSFSIVVDEIADALIDPASGYELHVRKSDYCLDTNAGDLEGDLPLFRKGDLRVAGNDQHIRHCDTLGPFGDGPDLAWRFTAKEDKYYAFDTLRTKGRGDHVVYLLKDDCGGEVLDCNDDAYPGKIVKSTAYADLEAGETVVVVVDSYGDSDPGEFELRISDGLACSAGGSLPGTTTVEDADLLMLETEVPGLEGRRVHVQDFIMTDTSDFGAVKQTESPSLQVTLHEGCLSGPIFHPSPRYVGGLLNEHDRMLVAVSAAAGATIASQVLETQYMPACGQSQKAVPGTNEFPPDFDGAYLRDAPGCREGNTPLNQPVLPDGSLAEVYPSYHPFRFVAPKTGTWRFTTDNADRLWVLDDCWGTQLACAVRGEEPVHGVDYGSVSLDVPLHEGEEMWVYVSQSIDWGAIEEDPPPPSLIVEEAPGG